MVYLSDNLICMIVRFTKLITNRTVIFSAKIGLLFNLISIIRTYPYDTLHLLLFHLSLALEYTMIAPL